MHGIQEVGGSTPPGSTKYPFDMAVFSRENFMVDLLCSTRGSTREALRQVSKCFAGFVREGARAALAA